MGWHASTQYGATKCLGEHPAPSCETVILMFHSIIVFRASSEYISERLDGSTHWRFTMPWRPDFLNHRPDWTFSLTVTCGPFAYTTKRGCIFSTARSSLHPLPGVDLPLVFPTGLGRGRILTGSPPDARPKTQNHGMHTTL